MSYSQQSIGHLVAIDRSSPIPLAVQIRQQLSLLIASRLIPEGETLPPIRVLADEIGVNLHTARAAYLQLERDGLVRIRRGVGTSVLPADEWRTSRSTAGPPTSTIGVIIPSHGFAYYAGFLSGVEAGASRSPLAFVCDAHENPERGRRYFDQLLLKQVDGIIVAGPMLPVEVVERHLGAHPPLVCADFPSAPGPAVEFDLDAAGRLASRHLVEHGHQRIGLITPPIGLDNVTPRVEAYRRTLADAQLPDDLIAEVGDWSPAAGARGLDDLLGHDPPPTAIVTVSGPLALGAIAHAHERGLAVPGDLAVTSMDTAPNQLIRPRLTSVRLSSYDLGRKAAEILDTIIAGSALDGDRHVLAADLSVRESCGRHG